MISVAPTSLGQRRGWGDDARAPIPRSHRNGYRAANRPPRLRQRALHRRCPSGFNPSVIPAAVVEILGWKIETCPFHLCSSSCSPPPPAAYTLSQSIPRMCLSGAHFADAPPVAIAPPFSLVPLVLTASRASHLNKMICNILRLPAFGSTWNTHTHNGMHTGLGARDGRKVVFSKRGMPVERWAPVLRAFSCRLAENVPHSDGPACGKVFKQICIQIKRWIKVDLHFQGARRGKTPRWG